MSLKRKTCIWPIFSLLSPALKFGLLIPKLDYCLESSNVTANVDFTHCGFYPACTAYAFFEDNWIFTCDHAIVVFIAVVGILLSAIIIICNVLIISVIAATKSLRKPNGYFKMSLAVAGWYCLPLVMEPYPVQDCIQQSGPLPSRTQ